jgi:hypothetical protein
MSCNRRNYVARVVAGCVLMLLVALSPRQAWASVGLVFFGAQPGSLSGEVLIRWGTETETDIVGFRVKRSTQPLIQTAVMVATVPSRGSATTGSEYEIVDSGLVPGQIYYYWLLAIAGAGQEDLLTQAVSVVAPGGTGPGRHYFFPVIRHST